MNLNDFPPASELPAWWTAPPTPEQFDAMAEAYQREQIASAQSEDAPAVDPAGTYTHD